MQSFGFALDDHHNYQIALSILPIGMMLAFVLCFFIKANAKESHQIQSEVSSVA